MLSIILFVFIVAFLILASGNFLQSKHYKFLAIVPFSLFLFFLYHLFTVKWEISKIYKYEWIPSLGINLNLKLDGLSLLFSLLITGIGSLVYFYSSYYLKKYDYLNRFYCYLSLFMGAMLGLVLSDNLIAVFMFWELTSITSFFLIGFNNEEEASRNSALTALGITGLGGFLLLSGFLLLGNITGGLSIHEMLNSSELIQKHAWYPLILIFVFAGAFTKSAQFPFHFWLPGAMQAPTPVSAYLHSATMVKAGIYILARFTPILSDDFYWNYTLMIVGGFTMLYGAYHSIFRTDMKAILAYSTISALGIIVFLLGIGSEHAIYAAVTFILVHALYKATLFLTTGIVDHAVHTRNITQIGGLGRVMPIVAGASFIAALSSAGVPLMFGFISKDLIYECTLHIPTVGYYITALAVLTNIFLACSGLMAGVKPFIGKLPDKFKSVKSPSIFLWLPIVILSFLSVLFGLMPFIADKGILSFAHQVIYTQPSEIYLKVWHGFNIVLILSVITIAGGVILFLLHKGSEKSEAFIAKFDGLSPQNFTHSLVDKFRVLAFIYTRFMHNGYLRNYLISIIVFITILVGYRLFTAVPLRVNTTDLHDFNLYELTIFVLIVISIFLTIRTKSRLTAIASLGAIGFCICLIFVFYGAPDLAMTQFTIDTLTVVLFVLVLFKLPPFLSFKNPKILIRDGLISLAFGVLIMIIALQALVAPATKETSIYYADNAYLLAKGKNVVNVILVDFRGFDTMIETIVLSIAAMGVYGMLKYRGNNEETD